MSNLTSFVLDKLLSAHDQQTLARWLCVKLLYWIYNYIIQKKKGDKQKYVFILTCKIHFNYGNHHRVIIIKLCLGQKLLNEFEFSSVRRFSRAPKLRSSCCEIFICKCLSLFLWFVSICGFKKLFLLLAGLLAIIHKRRLRWQSRLYEYTGDLWKSFICKIYLFCVIL